VDSKKPFADRNHIMIDLCAIRKLQIALREFEQELKNRTGLSLNEAMALCAIKNGATEPKALASRMELSPSRMTRVLDGLEARKFITRGSMPGDRRGVRVSMTRSGADIVAAYCCCDMELPPLLLSMLDSHVPDGPGNDGTNAF
jgi:DNA-binding MarR family transcriptional regulator